MCLSGSAAVVEPEYTSGRVQFNMTGDTCSTNAKLKYNLLVLLVCDYSSHIADPLTLMPYVGFFTPNS